LRDKKVVGVFVRFRAPLHSDTLMVLLPSSKALAHHQISDGVSLCLFCT
jgi:hypothetical protein